MALFDYDIGIIGGGSAGLTVAAGAAQLGARTLLVDKEKHLGGDCLYYGCVPSKTLIRTARAYHNMKHARAFGLPAVECPPVDFSQVRERIRSVIAVIQQHDSEERFCGLGAKVEFGAPFFTDDHAVRLNGSTVSAKNWIITTGSSPSVPRLPGLDRTPYLTNREIFYLDRLPRSLIVLGAGPVAIEMAQAFSRLGTGVTVVQRSGRILSNEDQDLADTVMQVLESEGVAFHLNATVLSADDKGNERELIIRNKAGQETRLAAEHILVALGREPNLGDLGLERIGVALDRRGLQLDHRLRTTQKHIYGAGDVTGAFQFTHAAGYEGSVVIANAVFHLPRKADYTFMPRCTYTDPELAVIGMNEQQARDAGLAYTVWAEPFAANDRSLAEGEIVGSIKMLLDRHEKPLGIQILGPRAGELLNEWVAVLNGKVKLSTLASAVHPYPTLGEINKRVAGAFLSPKIFSDRMRKGLKLFFNLRGRACQGPAP